MLLLSSLKTVSRWMAGVSSHLPWHKMSKTLWKILSVTSKHALCNDSKRHVTLIAVNHLIINLSVGTVPNAPIMIGTTVSFAQFLDPFQLPLQVLVVLILFYWKSNGQAKSIIRAICVLSYPIPQYQAFCVQSCCQFVFWSPIAVRFTQLH